MFILLMFTIGYSLGYKNYYCDKVVYEHYYRNTDNGLHHSYDELIFYEYDPQYRRYHVIAWKIVDKENILDIYYKSGDTHCFLIESAGKKVIIRTKIFEEVTTIGEKDLERQNKDLFPEEFRVKPW